MTINELIKSLEATPKERRNEKVRIYLDGPFSGYLDINDFHLDGDPYVGEEYNYIASVPFRERDK